VAPSEWVLDTGILEIASTGEDPRCLKAAALLDATVDRHLVALDVEGDIRKEYARHISTGTHAAVWWSQIGLRKRLVFHSHKLPTTHRRGLTAAQFDPSDWKFVGVALRTPTRLLVAEDSDYWAPPAAQYIQNAMRISLLRITEAVQQA
jgi:hypothetical protein